MNQKIPRLTHKGVAILGTFCLLLGLISFQVLALETKEWVACVRGEKISQKKLEEAYQKVVSFSPYRSSRKKDVLEALIKEKVGVQEAKRLRLDQDPEMLERMDTLLYQFLLEKKLTKEIQEIHIETEETEKFYNENPEIRTSQIFISVAPNASSSDVKKAYARMVSIKNEGLKNRSFSEAAKKFSESPSALSGGDIYYQSRESLDPLYYETAIKLAVGKTSEIIRTNAGYFLIQLTAIRPWEEANKLEVQRLVFEKKRAEIFNGYMNQLKKKADVVYSDMFQEH